jgi:hypothetical protein
MLFDLKGKRRRTVQATYVALAFLMAAGLVGAGIGSGASGGLFDLFGGGGGGSDATKQTRNRLKKTELTLRANPTNVLALTKYMEDEQLLAQADFEKVKQTYGKDGKAELSKAGSAWQRYMAAGPKKPSVELANRARQTYVLLGQAAGAAQAGEIIANAGKDWQPYARWSCYATVAHQTRKATLAGQHAIDLAGKSGQKKAAQQYVQSVKVAKTLTTCG